MKKLILFLSILLAQQAFSQKTSLSFGLNGGAAAFYGADAKQNTEIWTGSIYCGDCEPVAASSFGSKPGFSFGVSGILQHQFKNRMVAGLEAGWESLRTRATIEKYVQDDMIFTVRGNNVSNQHFVNFFPHAGYDIKLRDGFSLTTAIGADFGIGLKSFDRAKIPDFLKGTRIQTDDSPALDFRPRVHLQLNNGRIGIVASYSHGLVNYQAGLDGANREVYMKAFRLGVQYRLF